MKLESIMNFDGHEYVFNELFSKTNAKVSNSAKRLEKRRISNSKSVPMYDNEYLLDNLDIEAATLY